MKKYNMPTMEISLFDAEVVSTSSENQTSTAMEDFTRFQESIGENGIARTISWDKLKFTYWFYVIIKFSIIWLC